jgi:prevent-host-death family protein
MSWQLREAKQRFSEVVRRAVEDGPQVVTRHGEEVVVVLSAKEFRRLRRGWRSLKEFLHGGPDISVLEITRKKDLPRKIEL